MSEKGLKHCVFYLDNCMAQNKNTYYVSMLWYALHRFSLTCIEHKYLEKGHTQIENDTIHSSIESASKKISIYTTAQWAATVRLARYKKPYKVKEMDLADIFDFKDVSKNLKNFHLDLNRDKVNWLNIRTMKIACTEPNI